MTVNDFVLHPDHKPWSQRTDADLFGVRFPFRKELEFEDDAPFLIHQKPYFVIGEITRGECKLNGPWTDPAKENMQYVLRTIGAFDKKMMEDIAEALYERYYFDDTNCRVELIAFGKRINQNFSDPKKPLVQVQFDGLCRFIYSRFSRFVNMKKDHQHWDYAGRRLWDLAEKHWDSEDAFVTAALNSFGILET